MTNHQHRGVTVDDYKQQLEEDRRRRAQEHAARNEAAAIRERQLAEMSPEERRMELAVDRFQRTQAHEARNRAAAEAEAKAMKNQKSGGEHFTMPGAPKGRIRIGRPFQRAGKVEGKMDRTAIDNKMLRPGEDDADKGTRIDQQDIPEDTDTEGALAGVEFASVNAEELALEHGLSDADFKRRHPSGQTGFTVDDVRQIIAKLEP